MEYQKKNFKFGQKVKVIKTASTMDGVQGTITGIASINWFDVYIVSLEKPMNVNTEIMPTFQTFTMPETCLDPIEEDI